MTHRSLQEGLSLTSEQEAWWTLGSYRLPCRWFLSGDNPLLESELVVLEVHHIEETVVTLFYLHVQWIKYISLLKNKNKRLIVVRYFQSDHSDFCVFHCIKVLYVASSCLLQSLCCQTDKTGSKWKINLKASFKVDLSKWNLANLVSVVRWYQCKKGQ